MNTTRKWNVSNYAWWDFTLSKWQVPLAKSNQPQNMILVIKGAQFSLISKKTVMESFSLVQKPNATRVHVKNGCLAVITKCGQKYRKFKILFDSVQDAEEATRCLKEYVKIGGDKSSSSCEAQTPIRDTLPQILEQLMTEPHPDISAPQSIPEDYPLESAVRLCILDPGFPSLVQRIEDIVSGYFK